MEKLNDIIETVNLKTFIDNLDQGIDTVVGKKD